MTETPITKYVWLFGYWVLELIWLLKIGYWNLWYTNIFGRAKGVLG